MVPPQQLQQQQQQQQQQQPPAKRGKHQRQLSQSYAALWSLDPSCKEQEVKDALAAIGFNPEHLEQLGCGVFGLAFGNTYTGLTFSLALDGIDSKKVNLKYHDEGIRAAPWPPNGSEDNQSSLGPWDMPPGVQDSMARFAEKVTNAL